MSLYLILFFNFIISNVIIVKNYVNQSEEINTLAETPRLLVFDD